MNPSHFEALNFRQPSGLEHAAASLIVTEINHKGTEPPYVPNQKEIKDYVEYANYSKKRSLYEEVHYASIDDRTGTVVGISRVDHRCPVPFTHVDIIAVRRDLHFRGYGRALMGYIAQEALRRGDTAIKVAAYEPAFFQQMGFVSIAENDTAMHATIESILRH